MKRCTHSRGFALLLTLLLVVMVGVALAGLARWSMLGAVEAQDATEAAQRKWAVMSLQAALLPRVPALLDSADAARKQERRPKPPHMEMRFKFRMTDMDYELVMTDEQAKLNVNRLVEQTNPAEAESAVKRLLSHSMPVAGELNTQVRLRPTVLASGTDGADLPRLGSYGQFLEHAAARDLVGTVHDPGLAAMVTCWGDGHINAHRAPAPVIQQVCSGVLTRDEIATFLSLRDADPYRSVSGMLERQAIFDDKQKSKLLELFTNESKCFGMWIVARNAQRSWHTLVIGEGARASKSSENSRDARPDFDITQRYYFIW